MALALAPNCLVQVEPDAEIEIQRLAISKDGNETGPSMRARGAEVRLKRGGLIASHFWGAARAYLAVTTSHGEAVTPSNALFSIETDEQKTRITCASGWIEFKARESGLTTRIPPGSSGTWSNGKENIVPAESDPEGQDDLQRALQAEQRLRSFAAQKRNVFPR